MEDNFLKLTNTVYKLLEFFPESDPLKNRAKDKVLAIMENLTLVTQTKGWASFQNDKIKLKILEDIDILLGYLEIGKTQGWLNSVNFLIIGNEYEKIKKIIEPAFELTQKLPLPFIDCEVDDHTLTEENFKLEKNGLNKLLNKPCLPIQNITAILKESEETMSKPELNDKKEVKKNSDKSLERQKKILEFLKTNERAQVMDLQTILPDITKRTIRRDLDELLEAGKIIRLGEYNKVFYKINQI